MAIRAHPSWRTDDRRSDLLRISERGRLGRCPVVSDLVLRHLSTLLTAEQIVTRCATGGDEIRHPRCHWLVYWPAAVTFFQLLSGLNEVKCSAMLAVCGPRSFSKTASFRMGLPFARGLPARSLRPPTQRRFSVLFQGGDRSRDGGRAPAEGPGPSKYNPARFFRLMRASIEPMNVRPARRQSRVSGAPCPVPWSVVATTGNQNAITSLRDEVEQIRRGESHGSRPIDRERWQFTVPNAAAPWACT